MKTGCCQKRIDIYLEKFRRYLHQNTTLPDEVIDAVVSVSKSREYKKGENFSKQGEFCDKLAYICTGIFHGFSTQDDGSLFVARFPKEDDFLKGGVEMLGPSTLTIQAICDSVVVEVKKNVMQDMYLQYPQLGSVVLSLVEKCFVTQASHMIRIGTNNALDNYLLFKENFQDYEDRIPKHLVAAYLGITPTQLSRIRKKIAGEKQVTKSISL